MQKVNSLTVGQWCDRPLMFMQPGHAEAIFAADGAPDAQKDHHGSRRWLHQICGSAANLRCPGSEERYGCQGVGADAGSLPANDYSAKL